MLWYITLVPIGLASLCATTLVNQCPGGNIKNLQEHATVGKCVKPPCKLRKNTKVPLTLKFVAEYDYKNLTQIVNADIAGVTFPFLGIDGTSPCDKIYEEDGTTKSECRFQKGKMYVFKDAFDIYEVYPRVRTTVHWSITDLSTGKHAICLEVPAVITN